MDKNIAERLITEAIALDPGLNKIDQVISEITDQDERNAFARSLGNIISEVFEAFILPVSREYPDLAEKD